MDDLFYREFAAGEARNRPRLRPAYTVLISFEYCMESWKLMMQMQLLRQGKIVMTAADDGAGGKPFGAK